MTSSTYQDDDRDQKLKEHVARAQPHAEHNFVGVAFAIRLGSVGQRCWVQRSPAQSSRCKVVKPRHGVKVPQRFAKRLPNGKPKRSRYNVEDAVVPGAHHRGLEQHPPQRVDIDKLDWNKPWWPEVCAKNVGNCVHGVFD